MFSCRMALMKRLTSVFGLSPENEDEFVKVPAILSFHAKVNQFSDAASMKAFIPADMLPMQFGHPKMIASATSSSSIRTVAEDTPCAPRSTASDWSFVWPPMEW